MMTIRHIDFGNEIVALSVPGVGHISIKGVVSENGELCDVVLCVFGHDFLLKQFASCRTRSQVGGKEIFLPSLDCALGDAVSQFVIVVGLRSVLIVNFATQKVEQILHLFRSSEEDQGFYRLELFPWKDSLLLLYESGIALIRQGGDIAWHHPLDWSDIFLQCDDTDIYFMGEFEEKTYTWTVSIEDGAIYGHKGL